MILLKPALTNKLRGGCCLHGKNVMFPDAAGLDTVLVLVGSVAGRPPVFGDLPVFNHTAMFMPAVRALADMVPVYRIVDDCHELL